MEQKSAFDTKINLPSVRNIIVVASGKGGVVENLRLQQILPLRYQKRELKLPWLMRIFMALLFLLCLI